VAHEGVSRGFKAQLRMAVITAIEIRSTRKLFLVCIFVTVGATLKLDFVSRSFAGGSVALCAGNYGVLAPKRERSQIMFDQEELRRLEALHRMARFAFATVNPLRELAAMGVGVMAVGTLAECKCFLEISPRMAINATYVLMFAEKRILGF